MDWIIIVKNARNFNVVICYRLFVDKSYKPNLVENVSINELLRPLFWSLHHNLFHYLTNLLNTNCMNIKHIALCSF